jgi:hypothetical protein
MPTTGPTPPATSPANERDTYLADLGEYRATCPEFG